MIKTIRGKLPWSTKDRWKIPAMDGINVMDFSFGVGPVDLDAIMPMVEPHLVGRRTCIQAGGCFGVWPTFFAQMFGRVITFEPEPENFRCLVENTADLANVQCINAAVWNTATDKVGMGLDRKMHNNSGAYFIELGGGTIPTARIDDLNAADVDLLALDVEGAEYAALVGSADTIARCRPVIVLEDKGHDGRYGGKSAVALLCDDMGYRLLGRPTPWDVVLVPTGP